MSTSEWIAGAALVVALWTRWQANRAIKDAGTDVRYNLGKYKSVEGWAVLLFLDDAAADVHQPVDTKAILCLSEGEALGVAAKLADQGKDVLVCKARHVTA